MSAAFYSLFAAINVIAATAGVLAYSAGEGDVFLASAAANATTAVWCLVVAA